MTAHDASPEINSHPQMDLAKYLNPAIWKHDGVMLLEYAPGYFTYLNLSP